MTSEKFLTMPLSPFKKFYKVREVGLSRLKQWAPIIHILIAFYFYSCYTLDEYYLRAYLPPSISMALMTNSISFSSKLITAVAKANLTS